MVSEEKDQYIEKLRRRNHRAWEKIQELEDYNAESFRTIMKQQNLLELLKGTLTQDKLDFKKQIAEKDEEILTLKNQLLKEKGAQVISGKGQSDATAAGDSSTLFPAATPDTLNTEKLTSSNLNATKGDSNDVVDTKPIIKEANLSSNQTENSGREEMFSELLRKVGDSSSQDEQLIEPQDSKNDTVNSDGEAYSQFQLKLDKLNGLNLENQSSEDLLRKMGLGVQNEKRSQDSDNEYKDAPNIKDDELPISLSNYELAEARRSATESALRRELNKAFTDIETENLTKESLIQKVNDLNALVQQVNEDKIAEIMSLTHAYQLEKQQRTKQIETLEQQFKWMKVSKMLTVNSVASELERLRNVQSIQPREQTKTTSRYRFVIPLPSFFN